MDDSVPLWQDQILVPLFLLIAQLVLYILYVCSNKTSKRSASIVARTKTELLAVERASYVSMVKVRGGGGLGFTSLASFSFSGYGLTFVTVYAPPPA